MENNKKRKSEKMVLDGVKSFGINLAVGLATEIVRGYLNGQIKDIEPSDLYEAIIQDRDLWTNVPDDIKTTGQRFKNTYGNIFEKFEDRITTELLLQWMKEDHPSLYSTIINTTMDGQPIGIYWFAKQVELIKQQIREM